MLIDGKFSLLMKTPMGPQKGNITFTPAGANLKGVFASILGTNEFTGGGVDGDDFFFSFKADTQMGVQTFEVKGSIEGDEITGVIKTTMGAFPYEGTREE